LSFVWLVAPFVGAILWGVIAAVVFHPLNQRLLRAWPGASNRAALASLLVIVVAVVVPALMLGVALLGEGASFYARIQSGEIDLAKIFLATQGRLPDWAMRALTDFGMGDIGGLRAKLGQGMASSFQLVLGQLLSLGQGTLGIFLALGVMLYLTFFLLRDGVDIAARIENCIPLPADQRRILICQFVTVIRATIKGTLIVALAQGAIGGFVFWMLGLQGALLWGVAMGFFSLFPAVGTGLIWVPMTLYLAATGALWQAAVLGAAGLFVISTIDNILRPILVGRDTAMPDYVVLIATLGGFELMGFNGFVLGPVVAAIFMAVWGIFENAQRSQSCPTDG
jgi:predicted PurR-regulated permease PerM